MIKPVILWTDVLIFMLTAVVIMFIVYLMDFIFRSRRIARA